MSVQRQPGSGGLPSAVNVDDAGLNDADLHDAGLNDADLHDAGLDDADLQDAGADDDGVAHPTVPVWKAVTGVVVGSVLATTLGTVLHAQVLHAEGFDVPLGAFAALIFSCSVAVFMGLWAGSVWFTAGTGVLTYVLTGILATTAGTTPLIVTGYQGMGQTALSMAGNIWIIGQAVATIAAIVISSLCLRGSGDAMRRSGDARRRSRD